MIKITQAHDTDEIFRGYVEYLFGDYPVEKLRKKDLEWVIGFLMGVVHDNCNAAVWLALGDLVYQPDWEQVRKARKQKEIDDAREWLDKKEAELKNWGVFRTGGP